MEFALIKKDQIVSELYSYIIIQYNNSIYNIIKQIRLKIQSLKKLNAYEVLILTIIILLEHLIKTTTNYSSARIIMLKILIDIIVYIPNTYCSEKEIQKLTLYYNKLININNLIKEINTNCECVYLYYHTNILQTLVEGIYSSSTEVNRLQYVICAFEDGIK